MTTPPKARAYRITREESVLAVNRGNRIDAVGTPTQPIIFTGRGNVVGSANDQTSQLWGGIVLLGRAPITDCLAPGATPGTAACERDTEGTSNALYGGAQPGDNSGRLSYVQIRYSGFILSAASELQGLTPSGVGNNTQIDHVQIHNSSDDGIEVFGGRVNMKHLVVTGAEDDGWLIGLVVDMNDETTDIVILNADDFTGSPQAVVHLPHRVPPGFHGNWVAD